MSEVWFIRHGESESNAGLPTSKASASELTDRGWLQAQLFAQYIPHEPDLIVVSAYTRTQQSALPTQQRFPDTPLETWPVHEYTYLSSDHYVNSTVADRQSAAYRYWLLSDPSIIQGDQAESFNQMLARVEKTRQLIKKDQHKFILIFTHGWFIRALLWKLYTCEKDNNNHASPTLEQLYADKHLTRFSYRFFDVMKFYRSEKLKMWHYLFFSSALHLPNISVIQCEYKNGTGLMFKSLKTEHIPPELIGSKFLDR